MWATSSDNAALIYFLIDNNQIIKSFYARPEEERAYKYQIATIETRTWEEEGKKSNVNGICFLKKKIPLYKCSPLLQQSDINDLQEH